MITCTAEQFATWAFEYDLQLGCWEDEYNEKGQLITSWQLLDEEDRKVYLQEAQHYIQNEPRENWPLDILDRLEQHP